MARITAMTTSESHFLISARTGTEMHVMSTKTCAALNSRCWLTDRLGVDSLRAISDACPDEADARYLVGRGGCRGSGGAGWARAAGVAGEVRAGVVAGRAPVRVFISYAHDDAAHEERVRDFWLFLRANGIDARLDLPAAERRQDWAQWMTREIRDADRVAGGRLAGVPAAGRGGCRAG